MSVYQNVPESPPALLGGWILPHQGGGEFFIDLDAPQLYCGKLHFRSCCNASFQKERSTTSELINFFESISFL